MLIGYWSTYRNALYISWSPSHYYTSPATTSNRRDPYIYSFHTDNTNYAFYDTGDLLSQWATSSISGVEWWFNRAGFYSSERAELVVSEILIFDTKLESEEREKVEWYLAHKWGQEWKLPNNHPHKSEPPEAAGPPPAPDTTPDAFAFDAVTWADLSTEYTSNPITITWINTQSEITVSGGEYSINNTSYTSATWSVSENDTVRIRLTSSENDDTNTIATLTVGWVPVNYTVRTLVADLTPDTFSFNPVTDADLSTTYISNAITVSGINTQAAINISGTGAEYKISDGVPYDVTGTGTAWANFTYPGYSAEEAFDNITATRGWLNTNDFPAILSYNLGGGQQEFVSTYTLFRNGSLLSGHDYYSPKNWTFEWSEDGTAWTVLDTRTDEIIYENQTKKTYTIASPGIYQYYRINITANHYPNTLIKYVTLGEVELINDQGVWVFTTAPGIVENGDIVSVRMPSSANAGTLKQADLTIGTYSDSYDITTIAPDSSPDGFSFSDEIGADLNTQYTREFFVSWINTPTPVSITAGSWVFEINDGWEITSWNINNGDRITLKLTSPAVNSASDSTELTIGDQTAIFNISTIAPPPDLQPDSFSFIDEINASLSTEYISNLITVSGVNQDINISIAWGEYAISPSLDFTNANGIVQNGDVISVRATSSASPGQDTDVVLTLSSWGNAVSDTYTITTVPPDTSPEAFTLNTISNANINQLYPSDSITISGINTVAPVSISGSGRFSINGWAFGTSWNVNNGDTIIVELWSASTWWGASTSTTLTVWDGPNNTATFTTQTGVWDTSPDDFSFNDIVDANLNSLYFSDPITITGINAATSISISWWKYRIWATGEFTDVPWTIQNWEELTIRLTSSISWETTTTAAVNIGDKTDSYDVTTIAYVTSPDVAAREKSNVYVSWNYNGLIVHGNTDDTHYVFAAPSLITTDLTDTDIETIHTDKRFVYTGFDNIPWSYVGNGLTMTGGFDYTGSTPLLYEGSKEDLWSYGWLQQVDAGIRGNYSDFPAYYNIVDQLDNHSLSYVENILSESIGINPIKPYYCNDIRLSKLLYNVAPDATITASPTAWSPYGTWWIANGIKSAQWDLDYEYHSADGNAIINFEWETLQNVWYVKIYNRTSHTQRLSWAVIKLYNATGDILYSHPLWDTTWDYVVDLDLEGIGELHYVKKLSIETVWGNYLNLREVEIYTGWGLKDGIYKVDRDGAGWSSPYNVYCDMTTDGWGWTRIGENYIENGGFESQQHIFQHSFSGYDWIWDNVILDQSTELPPVYIPDAYVMRHDGSNSEYYELYFPEVPGSYFAQEIRLSLWVKWASSGIFPYDISYLDGTNESWENETFEISETDGDWTLYKARIPLESEVDTFSWKIGRWTTGFFFTGADMEIYYR